MKVCDGLVPIPLFQASGGCEARCRERRNVRANRCVAYSVSISDWEEDHCSMWDSYGFIGPSGDGDASSRLCFTYDH